MSKYKDLMKDYKVTLDNPVLDPAFVSKANEFEEKLKSDQLTDEEIVVADDELVELFKTLQELSEEDSEEVTAANHAKDVAEARAAIAECNDSKELVALQEKYKQLPEVLPVITAKIEKLVKEADKAAKDALAKAERNKEAKRLKAIEDGTKEIQTAKYEDLQIMGEKYKEFPELIKLVNERHINEKPGKADEELKKTLLSKNEWNYSALRAMGITPTGNDMTVAGVRLEREYLLEVYAVRR
jgi:hypothetical protein